MKCLKLENVRERVKALVKGALIMVNGIAPGCAFYIK